MAIDLHFKGIFIGVSAVCFVIHDEYSELRFVNSAVHWQTNTNISKQPVFFFIADAPQQKGFVNFFKSLPEVRIASMVGSRTIL